MESGRGGVTRPGAHSAEVTSLLGREENWPGGTVPGELLGCSGLEPLVEGAQCSTREVLGGH